MSGKRDRIERLLDESVREIRDRKADPVMVKEAADRVWMTLSSRDPGESRSWPVELRVVSDYDEFRGLIKPYLNHELSEPRSLLLEDHFNECLSCRRELKIARDGVELALPVPYRSTGWPKKVWLGLAAALHQSICTESSAGEGCLSPASRAAAVIRHRRLQNGRRRDP